jgi:hypothetical protein
MIGLVKEKGDFLLILIALEDNCKVSKSDSTNFFYLYMFPPPI